MINGGTYILRLIIHWVVSVDGSDGSIPCYEGKLVQKHFFSGVAETYAATPLLWGCGRPSEIIYTGYKYGNKNHGTTDIVTPRSAAAMSPFLERDPFTNRIV